MWELPASWAAYAEGALTRWLPIVALFFAGTSLAVMGRLDDRKGLGVAPRLLFQFVPALVVVACGVRASLFVDSAFVQIAVSVLWLVFMTNATNFIDNMDGLCVGTGLASACGIAVLAGLDGQILVMSLAAALAGAMAAVLVWNRPSARIYLGDEGSQFAGFMLGTLALVVSFRPEQGGEDGFSMVPFIAPLLLMIVPLCDGVTVIITRCRRGVAPWTAGLDHLSHRLAARVGGREGAVAGLVFVSFVGAAGAVMTVSREADYRLAGRTASRGRNGRGAGHPAGQKNVTDRAGSRWVDRLESLGFGLATSGLFARVLISATTASPNQRNLVLLLWFSGAAFLALSAALSHQKAALLRSPFGLAALFVAAVVALQGPYEAEAAQAWLERVGMILLAVFLPAALADPRRRAQLLASTLGAVALACLLGLVQRWYLFDQLRAAAGDLNADPSMTAFLQSDRARATFGSGQRPGDCHRDEPAIRGGVVAGRIQPAGSRASGFLCRNHDRRAARQRISRWSVGLCVWSRGAGAFGPVARGSGTGKPDPSALRRAGRRGLHSMDGGDDRTVGCRRLGFLADAGFSARLRVHGVAGVAR